MAEQGNLIQARINEDYLVAQINGFRKQWSHTMHKTALQDFDSIYRGDVKSLFPDEDEVPDKLLIENKLKNATHDLARLASDARGVASFMRDTDNKTGKARQQMRNVIASTIYTVTKGRKMERQLYLDFIAGGIACVAGYYNGESVYPQVLRLDPRFVYPSVRNGVLRSLVYVETMKERDAAYVWEDLGLNKDKKNERDVTISTYYDDHEVVTSVGTTNAKGDVTSLVHVQRWEHELGCVPVAFVNLDSADGSYHGLLDQLAGPVMVRSKIVRLLVDYLESMVHAPLEYKNIIDPTEEPGPLAKYEHDPTAEESFIRRMAPAAPAGSVFGLLQYMQGEEAAEAIQPPSRVGIVRQSIASGSFVDSTQGTLSSVVLELQEAMAELRYELNCILFKIDVKHMNYEKPLMRAVGNKHMYTPKDDMGDWHFHTIQYGAGAGVNRAAAANRVQLDLGAGLIDKGLAREQIDYIDDPDAVQRRIDAENLSNVFFQRFSTDPNTKMSHIAQAILEMGKGKDFLEVIEQIAPELVAEEEEAAEAQKQGMQQPAAEPTPEEDAETLEAGGQLDIGGFQPPPLQQQIVRSIY